MLALSVVFLACAPAEGPQEFSLRIATAGELAPLQPRVTSTFTTAAADLVYQTVLRVGEHGELRPGAVRAWERLASDRVRVQLDPALRFSDGQPVRAEDVVASLAAAGLEVTPGGEWLEIRPGTSKNPLEVTLLLFAVVYKEATPAPLGTGPFRLLEGDARHIVLERVRPEPDRIARVEIRSAPTPRDAFAWALRGDVNAVTGLDDRQSELIDGVPAFRIIRGDAPHALAIIMNSARFSRDERLGLAEWAPRLELARAYGGRCAPLESPVGAHPAPPGRPLAVATSVHDPGLPRMALSLRRALGPRGGDVLLEPASRAAARVAAGDFDLFVTGIVAWPPVMLGGWFRTGSQSNWSGYSNPLVDQAFDQGDLEAARAVMERDPPVVLVCRRQRIAAVDARLKNATLGSWGLLETLPDWEVSP